MINLKNSEAVQFTSPLLSSLFADSSRTFPMQDAFKISDAIEVIRTRLKPYFEKQKAIIEQNKGNIAADGRVTYPTLQDQETAQSAMEELGAIELEYPLEKITPTGNWPNLSLTEALILKPILNMNGAKK